MKKLSKLYIILRKVLSLTASGYFVDGAQGLNGSGYYWTQTFYDVNYMSALDVRGSIAYRDKRYAGFTVRCLIKV